MFLLLCLLDNILQLVVLQQAEPAEMDRLGKAAEKAAGQVWARAHRLLWSRVLHTQCQPTATGDHKVRFRQWHEVSCTRPITLVTIYTINANQRGILRSFCLVKVANGKISSSSTVDQ